MSEPKVSKVDREALKMAQRNGARILIGKKHVLVYDGPELLFVLSRGGHKKDRVPGGTQGMAVRKMRKRGWK